MANHRMDDVVCCSSNAVMNDVVPRVSLGLPVYNGDRWLHETLPCLLSQTFADFELIICDNGSTDGTEAICREYAQRDSRVRYVRNAHNIGAIANYNLAFNLARGEYFKWASSNDWITPDFLEKCVDALDANPGAVLCCPKTRLFVNTRLDATDYTVGMELLHADAAERYKHLLNSIQLNNVMNGLIRADILRKTPLFKDFYSSDVNLMAELALHGQFIEIPEFLFYRRMSPQAATKLMSEKELRAFFRPNNGGVWLPLWRYHAEFLAGIWRSPCGLTEKVALSGYVFKRLCWARRELGRDLLNGLLQLVEPGSAKLKRS